jgi:hypothetical protein
VNLVLLTKGKVKAREKKLKHEHMEGTDKLHGDAALSGCLMSNRGIAHFHSYPRCMPLHIEILYVLSADIAREV